MPRSATTLAEQILDAHPQVTGIGEFKDLDVLARMLPKALQIKEPLPEIIEYADENRLERMVDNYANGINNHGFAENDVDVNKNLRNGRLLGLIAMMFPSAKVILCHRDLRDIGVSAFMAGMNHGLFPEFFDLGHMAAAMRDHQRLVAHWRDVLPLEFFELGYEEVVRDQESQTRLLLEFCGLAFDERCLKFWESDRTVMTLSYDQVTRPMYEDSEFSWRSGKYLLLIQGQLPHTPLISTDYFDTIAVPVN